MVRAPCQRMLEEEDRLGMWPDTNTEPKERYNQPEIMMVWRSTRY